MKFRKITAAALSAVLMMSTVFGAAAEDALVGDVDFSGVVDVADILSVKNAIMTEDYTPEYLALADLDQSGAVDVGDILALKNIIMASGGATEIAPPPAVHPPEAPVDGWNTVGESRFYYKDGEFLTGHHDIGDFKYFFDECGVLQSHAGIDVSSFQEKIDWQAVAAEGAEFAFLRVGGRYWGSTGAIYSDDYFDEYAEQANAAGIKVGAYFFSQAITVEEAIEEADYVLSKIAGHTIEYPVVFDVERPDDPSARANKISKSLRTEIALAFCQRIEEAGYYPMIYTYPDWAKNGLDMAALGGYDLWLAHYTDAPDQTYPYTIWQYSEYADIDGIQWDRVDMNISYIDYAAMIREAGLNHLEQTEQPITEENDPVTE